HLPRLAALLAEGLVDDHHEFAVALVSVLGEFSDLDAPERHCGMAADQRCHFEMADLRIKQVLRRGLLRTLEQLLAVDDLDETSAVGAVSKIDAVALGAGGH